MQPLYGHPNKLLINWPLLAFLMFHLYWVPNTTPKVLIPKLEWALDS